MAKNILIKINVLQIDTNKIPALLCQYSAQSNTIFHYASIIGHFRMAQNFHRKKTATIYWQAKFVGQILKWPEDHYHGGSIKLFFQKALTLDRSQFL